MKDMQLQHAPASQRPGYALPVVLGVVWHGVLSAGCRPMHRPLADPFETTSILLSGRRPAGFGA